MNSQTKTLLVLLSISLNVALAIGWGVRALRTSSELAARPADAGAGSLQEQLGLSLEQQRQIESMREAFRPSAATTSAEINRRRQELLELLAEPNPDRERLQEKQREIRTGQRLMQELVLEQILAEKQVLLPAQQQNYFGLLQRRPGGPRHGGIAHWLQAAQTNQPALATNRGQLTPEPEE